MSTVLLTARHEVAYHGASGRKEVYAIFDQQSVRGLHGGPDLFWLAYEPGHFVLKLVYEPASLVPDEVLVYGKYANYHQARCALERIQAELEQVVENDRVALRRAEAQGFLARLVAKLKGGRDARC
jgi:hypothetical protein